MPRWAKPYEYDDDEDRLELLPQSNPAYEERVEASIHMIQSGVSHEEIRERHGFVVLREAIERMKCLPPKRRY